MFKKQILTLFLWAHRFQIEAGGVPVELAILVMRFISWSAKDHRPIATEESKETALGFRGTQTLPARSSVLYLCEGKGLRMSARLWCLSFPAQRDTVPHTTEHHA